MIISDKVVFGLIVSFCVVQVVLLLIYSLGMRRGTESAAVPLVLCVVFQVVMVVLGLILLPLLEKRKTKSAAPLSTAAEMRSGKVITAGNH